MRRTISVVCAVVLIGCTGSQDQTQTAADSAAAAPAGISLADVAGMWTVQVMTENSDSVLLSYQLTATADPAGWSIKLPDRADPIPLQVLSYDGDSIVVHAGPYPSALRAGVTVTTDGVSRLQNGMLVGRTTAHYTTTGPDSVVVLRTQGTRAQ